MDAENDVAPNPDDAEAKDENSIPSTTTTDSEPRTKSTREWAEENDHNANSLLRKVDYFAIK